MLRTWLITRLVYTNLLVCGKPFTLNGFLIWFLRHESSSSSSWAFAVMFWMWKWSNVKIFCTSAPSLDLNGAPVQKCWCEPVVKTLIQSSLAVVTPGVALLVYSGSPRPEHAVALCYLPVYHKDKTKSKEPSATSSWLTLHQSRSSCHLHWGGCLEAGLHSQSANEEGDPQMSTTVGQWFLVWGGSETSPPVAERDSCVSSSSYWSSRRSRAATHTEIS